MLNSLKRIHQTESMEFIVRLSKSCGSPEITRYLLSFLGRMRDIRWSERLPPQYILDVAIFETKFLKRHRQK